MAGVSESTLALIRPHFGTVKVPGAHEKVYKDECVFSFDTPYSAGGLYVSLSSWQGFGEDYVDLDRERTGNALYLHEKWTKVPRPAEPKPADMDGGPEPMVLGLGVDGGFATDEQKNETVKKHALVIFGRDGDSEPLRVPLPEPDLPTLIAQACDAIIAHQGAAEQVEVTSWMTDQELPVSKYAAELQQLPAANKISSDPTTWRCGDSGMTENLWLNLSTGYIGSGRRNWDGSGGTGAALRHYEETGRKYPLCVKLGTITAAGADVYSYAADEDCMVRDPLLAEHLRHWGIDAMRLEKTDRTMAELEVQLNKSYDFSRITEAGRKLRPLSGPGFVGIKNLGNSCYMNSCLQVLAALPEVGGRYYAAADRVFRSSPADPAGDFATQMAKVATGLLTSRYALEQPEGEGDEVPDAAALGKEVAPRMFKHLVGRGHAEFATGRQQDAAEYMQHLLEFIARAERTGGARLTGNGGTSGGGEGAATAPIFQFETINRLQCLQSGGVRYVPGGKDNVLAVQIPMEAAVNKDEVAAYKERIGKRQKLQSAADSSSGAAVGGDDDEEEVMPVVPFSACLERLSAPEALDGWVSPATGQPGAASKVVRMKNFPRYLFVQLRRYYVDEAWQPKKLEVEVDMPETLDLEPLRGHGLQPGETPLPEAGAEGAASGGGGRAAAPAVSAELTPDDELVAQLVSMGFSENGCKRAALAVKNANAEEAMNWLLEHMGDDNFNDPLPPPAPAAAGSGATSGSGAAAAAAVDPEAVAMLSSMGFTEAQAQAALGTAGGSPDRAADWLFSHADDLDAAVAALSAPPAAAAGSGGGDGSGAALEDGTGKYTLVGFISHVGKNTGSGHYLAHIRKGGRWVIFDDQKVAVSESTPLRLGYLYLYRRDDAPATA